MHKLYKVLLAEDDENSAKLVVHALERFNFVVTHVPDGMAALSKVRVQDFDLIISDIMMPYLDGLSFIDKAQEFIRGVPTIVLTAVGERKNVLRAAQKHVSFYILKPVEVDALLEKVLLAMKLEVADLFDKRSKPLQVTVGESGENILSLRLEGCPKKNSQEEIFKKVEDVLSKNSNLLLMDVVVDPIFFLEGNSFRVLDDFMLKVIKNTNLRGGNVRFFAHEIRESKLDPDKFPNLLSCKIEERG